MGPATTPDPAAAVNALAVRNGWPIHGSGDLNFDRPELRQLRDIWYEKAAGRPLPFRSDFTPRALKPVLRNIVILERVLDSGRTRYRIRLTGTDIARLMGDATGQFLDDRIPAEVLPRWLAVYDSVMDAQVPLRFVVQYEGQDFSYLKSESFNAPMLDAQGNPTMLLSCAYFFSTTAGTEIPH